jgi:ATP adenylyltransferase
MQRLWSPWRSQYVSQAPASDGGCIFCRFAQEEDDAANLVAYRGQRAYVVLNRFPYNSGHLMIVPYQHTSEFGALPPETLTELMGLMGLCLEALQSAFAPDGYNAGMNLGSIAGAGIADHLHLHVVPRWGGDTNFMPVLADVKVMPELLQDSYDKLVEALRASRRDGEQPA